MNVPLDVPPNNLKERYSMKFVEEQQNCRLWGKTISYIHVDRCLGL